MKVALTYAPGAFDIRGKIMGRQAAGLGFLRALADADLTSIGCYSASDELAREFARDVGMLSRRSSEVRYVPAASPEQLAAYDLLYRADPNIGDDAWNRQERSGARAYSLCGITHTLASKGVMAAISNLPDAPVYSWDAVICTSRVARDVVLQLIEARLEHIRRRFGATFSTLPQFPLIPLGVHVGDFVHSEDARAATRASVGIGAEEIAVLFAGRLTFHAKAHPLPMFLGLQRACEISGRAVVLLIFGQFPNTVVAETFREEAARFAPSVRLIVLDGAEPANGPRAWAAADIFTSLSDNIQETFGLTPVEAMAAGLPCVVSDWNGYKDTVRDGVDGFRVSIHAPSPGWGGDLGDRFAVGASDYDGYIGEVSLFTGVDVEAASKAYLRLIVSPELRRKMGDAGRRRAVELYDWPTIFRRYMALWEELGERRRSDPRLPGEQSRARRADRPDPYNLFRTFPTAVVGAETRVRLGESATAEEAVARKGLRSVRYAAQVLPGDQVISRLVTALATSPSGMTVDALRAACAPIPLGGVIRSVAFLAKMGIIQVVRDEPT